MGQDQGSQALGNVLLTIAQELDRVQSDKRRAANQLESVQGQLFELEQELNRRQAVVPDEYLVTFKAYGAAIKGVSANLESPSAMQTLAAISDDLNIKNKFLSQSAGISGRRAPPLITVSVRTKRGDVPAPGYQVSFNSFANTRSETPTHPVASDTNDAVRDLPPGAYTLRLYRGGKEVASRQVNIPSMPAPEVISIDVSSQN